MIRKRVFREGFEKIKEGLLLLQDLREKKERLSGFVNGDSREETRIFVEGLG